MRRLKAVLTCGVIIGLSLISANARGDGPSISPTDPGMYVQVGGNFTRVIGQIAEFTRTGSRFVSHATVGIKSAKVNIQLPGAHAQTLVSPQPVFYFIPAKQEAAAGVNAGDLILIRLEEKAQRRQFEIAAAGLFRASSGIALTRQIQILRSETSPGIYTITPVTELGKGEYALYLARGEGMAAYVYDFSVPATGVAYARNGYSGIDILRPSAARVAETTNTSSGPAIKLDVQQPTSPVVTALPTGETSAGITGAVGVRDTGRGGVLGVTGNDWEQDGITGVEIAQVSDDSSAQLAGLRKGNVITEVNGMHVRSVQELNHVLAQLEPGTRISIAYLYRSNLGWMPQQTFAILGKSE